MIKNKCSSFKLLIFVSINLLCVYSFPSYMQNSLWLYLLLLVALLIQALKGVYSSYVATIILFFIIGGAMQLAVLKELQKPFQWIFTELNPLRDWVKNRVQNDIWSEEQNGLVLNLILADKSFMAYEVKQQFNQVGLAHLITVSGMHVGMIYLALNVLLKKVLRLSVNWIDWLALILIFMYGCVAQFSIPVTRAILMISFYILSRRFFTQGIVLDHVLFSGAIMLIMDYTLIESWSFQFSFMGVLGIVLGIKYMGLYQHSLKWWKLIVNAFQVSWYAQLALIPLLLLNIGEISVWSLFLGVLFTPVFFVLMIFSFVAVALPLEPIIILMKWLLIALFYCVEVLPVNEWTIISVQNFTLFEVSLCYSSYLFAYQLWKSPKLNALIPSSLVLLVILSILFFRDVLLII